MRKPDWGQGKINHGSKVGSFFVSGNLDFVWKTAFLLHELCVGPVEALSVSLLARFCKHDRSVLI
jgi:hypothetical protein